MVEEIPRETVNYHGLNLDQATYRTQRTAGTSNGRSYYLEIRLANRLWVVKRTVFT